MRNNLCLRSTPFPALTPAAFAGISIFGNALLSLHFVEIFELIFFTILGIAVTFIAIGLTVCRRLFVILHVHDRKGGNDDKDTAISYNLP